MKLKKTKKANLEKKRPTFLVIGFVLTLSTVLVAFEWKQYDTMETIDFAQTDDFFEPEIEATFRKEKITPPPPPPPEIIVVVEDDQVIEDEPKIVDPETDEDQEMLDEQDIDFEPEVVVDPNEVFERVEEMPVFPGGEPALMQFMVDNIKYPDMAWSIGIQGTVFVKFVVEKDGSVRNAKVLRGIGGGCDKAALKMVGKMPNWKPGKQRDKKVRVSFIVPVKFVARN